MDLPSDSETFPGFSHIHSVSESGASRAFRVELEFDNDRPLFAGEVKPRKPLRAHWFMGAARPADVIWTTSAVPMLMSERVVQILRDGGFTGWDVIPVQVRGKIGEALPMYYFLTVLGRSGPIDRSRGERFMEQRPARWVPMSRGLYFDPATWDGSDIFLPEGTGYIFMVEPVKRALVRAKVKNVVFTRLDQYVRRVPQSEADPD